MKQLPKSFLKKIKQNKMQNSVLGRKNKGANVMTNVSLVDYVNIFCSESLASARDRILIIRLEPFIIM